MVTSQREGMALRTHEYVICQEGIYHPLILSEVSGGMATIHMTLNLALSSPAVTATAASGPASLSIHGTGETRQTQFIRYFTLHCLYLPLMFVRLSL